MTNVLQLAAQLAGQAVRTLASEPVTLTVGAEITPDIQAGIGKPDVRLFTDPQQIALALRCVDFLIDQADYISGDAVIEPKRGHRLTRADGRVYQVVPLGNEPCYRKMTEQGTMLRIHAMEAGQ